MRHYRTLAYALLRITLGVLLLTYGINKFFRGPATFAEGLRDRFVESWLPDGLVLLFGYGLPFLEMGLGVLLIAGLFNIAALATAGVAMMVLVFGAVAEPNPPAAANNMLYALVIFVLLWLSEANRFSLDEYWRRSRPVATDVPPEEDVSVTPRR